MATLSPDASLGELLFVYLATEVDASGWARFAVPRNGRVDDLLARFVAGEDVSQDLTREFRAALAGGWPEDGPTLDLIADRVHGVEELGARLLAYVRLTMDQTDPALLADDVLDDRVLEEDEIPIVVADPTVETPAAPERAAGSVLSELVRLRRDAAALQAHALDDPVSGLRNRRYLEERLREEISRARRDGGALSVGVLDLRPLEPGAALPLRELARLVREAVRAHDVVGRGGEASVVILFPGASADSGRVVLERIRRHLEARSPARVEVALGLASASPSERPLATELLALAEIDAVRPRAL